VGERASFASDTGQKKQPASGTDGIANLSDYRRNVDDEMSNRGVSDIAEASIRSLLERQATSIFRRYVRMQSRW
jgi:hypothetical protein